MLIFRLLRNKNLLQLQVQPFNATSQPRGKSVQRQQGQCLQVKSKTYANVGRVELCTLSNSFHSLVQISNAKITHQYSALPQRLLLQVDLHINTLEWTQQLKLCLSRIFDVAGWRSGPRHSTILVSNTRSVTSRQLHRNFDWQQFLRKATVVIFFFLSHVSLPYLSVEGSFPGVVPVKTSSSYFTKKTKVLPEWCLLHDLPAWGDGTAHILPRAGRDGSASATGASAWPPEGRVEWQMLHHN